MGKVQAIEQQVAALGPEEPATFHHWWFVPFDADAWDQQIAADVAAGRLESLATEALEQHRQGKFRTL